MIRLLPVLPAVPLLFALSASAAAVAQAPGPVVGDVEGGELRAFPIAIPQLRLGAGAESQKESARLLTRIVRADLDLSGAFQVLEEKGFIDTDGIAPAEVRFPDWQNVGAQGLVKARLTQVGNTIQVQLYAYEVASAKELGTKTISGDIANVRRLGHHVADEVFRLFTGEPGVFRTQLAAVRKVRGEKHIFVMDIDGEGARQITRDGGLNLLPSWSPDGASILYTSYRYDNPDLFEVSLTDGSVKALSRRPGLNTGGQVSPDGSRIALTLSQDNNSELYLLDRKGEIVKRLTNQWGIDTSPSWSPDGKQIAFVSSRGGHPDLYLMDVGTGTTRRLTFKGNYNQTPAFSPRGTHIAFTARDERNNFDIFTLQLKTGEIRRITQGQGNNEEPSFSPNGRLMVFTTTRNKTKQLVVSNLDGTKQTVLPPLGEHASPAWGPFVK
jgi:TolB protein